MTDSRRTLLIALILFCVTFLVFSQVIRFDFLRYDDEIYVYENPHVKTLAPENIAWIFSHGYFKSYTPLALLSHALDYAVWGTDARGHHFSNLILHSANAVLVFLFALMVLTRFRRGSPVPDLFQESVHAVGWDVIGGALAAALIFAVHPLRVESVSWISDRKDLLATFFLLPSLLCYLQGEGADDARRRRKLYVSSVLLFLFAALTKSFVIVTPVFLILMEFLLLRRSSFSLPSLVASAKEKLPYFVISALIAVAAQQSTIGDEVPVVIRELSYLERSLLPFFSPTFYLVMFFWPDKVTPVYVPPGGVLLIMYSLITIILVGCAALLWRRGKPMILASLIFYGIYLLPTLLGLSAGIQPWADRYTYFPLIGLALLGGGVVMVGLRQKRTLAVAGISVLLLGAATYRSVVQVPRWKDSLSLWTYASTVHPHPLTIVPLGISYLYAGKIDSALVQYQRALAIDSTSIVALYNLAVLYEKEKREDDALQAYVTIVHYEPDYIYAWNNLAGILLRRGEIAEAQEAYQSILSRFPSNADAHYNLGVVYDRLGKEKEATECYRNALKYIPGYTAAYINLSARAMRNGDLPEAIALLREGIRFDEKNAKLRFNLGVAFERSNDTVAALQSYTAAIGIDPKVYDSYVNLGNLYAHMGIIDGAATVYRKAIEAGLDSADVCFNYAIVLDALGDTSQARVFYRRAITRERTFLAPYLNLARGYVRVGEYDSAAGAYREALSNGVDSLPIREGLAEVTGKLHLNGKK